MEDTPKLNAIGTFKNKRTTKDKNNIAAPDIIAPPWI